MIAALHAVVEWCELCADFNQMNPVLCLVRIRNYMFHAFSEFVRIGLKSAAVLSERARWR